MLPPNIKIVQGVPFLQHRQEKSAQMLGSGACLFAPVRNVRLALVWPFVVGTAFVR